MRLFRIQYSGRRYSYNDFAHDAIQVHNYLNSRNYFASYASAEAFLLRYAIPSISYLDGDPSNWYTEDGHKAQLPWEIKELTQAEVITAFINQGIYENPNWPLWIEDYDKLQYVWRDPDNPEVVSFFDGRRITQMKPGRFLKRFYPRLNNVQVEYYARWWVDKQRPPREITGAVKFASTPDEIQDVYSRGPESCMLNRKAVRAYGAGDFAVAVFEMTSGEIGARVLVNTKTKVFGRIYPEDGEIDHQIEEKLREQGYVSLEENAEGFEGARFLKEIITETEDGDDIPDSYVGYMMPYLDRSVFVNPETWTATREYDRFSTLSSDSTSGYMAVWNKACVHCGEPSMAQMDRHFVFHEDHGERTALCPKHRRELRFEDSYSGQISWGIPALTTPDGKVYSRLTIGNHLYASDFTGKWYLHFQDNRVRVDGKIAAESELAEIGARFIYNEWTLLSDEEAEAKYSKKYFTELGRQASLDAYYKHRWFYDLIERREYHRPFNAGNDEIQAASRIGNGNDIHRAIFTISV